MTREHDASAAGVRPQRFRFGELTFDPDSGELTRRGEPVSLAPQPARVLAVLLRRAGEVVTREELYEELWGDDVHVDYRQGLNYCIRQVRIALGEDAQRPRFLETLSRRGYRFRVRPTVMVETRAQWRAAMALGGAVLLIALGVVAATLGDPAAPGRASAEAADTTAAPAISAAAPAALEPYLRARYLAGREQPDLGQAIEEYQRALRADADFAPAHAGLAEAYQVLAAGGALPPQDGYSRAVAAASRALELGHETADVYLARGIARLYRDLDWDAAAADFDRARRREPDSARAWFWHARALSASGAHEAAARAGERALLLDPESRQIVVDLGWFHVLAGRYRKAVAQCRGALELEPGSIPALQCLIGAHLRLGDRESAEEAGSRLLAVFAELTGQADPPSLARPVGREPDWARAGDWLAGLCPYNSFATSAAVVYTMAGDADAAIEQLRLVLERRQGWAPFLSLDPTFLELRDDPRFRALLDGTG